MDKKLVGGLIALIAVAALAVIGVTAMQKDDKASTNDTSTDTSQSNGSDEDANVTGQNEDTGTESTDKVAITDFAFTPATIKIKKGTTVTWTNNDSVEHTVTAQKDGGPDSELLAQGKTYSFTFNEVGTFDYFCKPHPNMTGTVIVEE